MGYWNTRGLRGSALEEMINLTNALYAQRGLAVIQKIPTPITPVEVNNLNHTISKAYFDQRSTVDYIGVAQGTAICFDAKETGGTSLPLRNIHSHQLVFMADFEKQGGVCFLLVSFVRRGDVFLLPFSELKRCWDAGGLGGRKSMPYDGFNKSCLVTNQKGFPLHYLETLRLYQSKRQEEKDDDS
ncbi:MAG: Holliday junction resolvase RecU [Clostridiales bacterium]|jgi:recombination protein U|nr:Holliday junction resolvase RecU [Clostridiales bacterium]